MVDNNSQKEYFEQAYRTGTDIWTHEPRDHRGVNLLKNLKPDSLVLDLGCGRGVWSVYLAKAGMRVAGVDYSKTAIESARMKAKSEGVEDRARFYEKDIMELTFQESKYDAVMDFGFLQHLTPDDWEKYAAIAHDALKENGLYFLEAMSKDTTDFFGHNPKQSQESMLDFHGRSFYFFTDEEIHRIFGSLFNILELTHEFPSKNFSLISCLMRKKGI